MEQLISDYILSMGLVLPLAILVAFRAGRLRGLNAENMEERLGDLAFDSVKEQISNKLEVLLQSQGVQLPPRTTIQDITAHLHGDIEDLGFLQTIYNSLVEQAVQSPYYMEAVGYIAQLISGGSKEKLKSI